MVIVRTPVLLFFLLFQALFVVFLHSKWGKEELCTKTAPVAYQTESHSQSIDVIEEKEVVTNLTTGSCRRGYFLEKRTKNCHKWFNCDDLTENFLNKESSPIAGRGLSKLVKRVTWSNHFQEFALSIAFPTHNIKFEQWTADRMKNGVDNLLNLQPNKNVIMVAGYCNEDGRMMLLTEYCGKYGTMESYVSQGKMIKHSPLERLEMVIQVIESFVLLHHRSGKPKVHCDLHSPLQALRQYLMTDDGRVVLNDVDDMPVDDQRNNMIAQCEAERGCIMSDEKFLAPEQRYTQLQCRRESRFITATVKADVWKIPDISRTILNDTIREDKKRKAVQTINSRLVPIHKRCKLEVPEKRPTSLWVLQKYMKIYEEIKGSDL